MSEAAQMRTIVSAKSITMPGGGDVHLIPPPPKPCVTIVVHGVNDLAGCYERIERGLCQGLNERLDMPETLPGGMSNPGYLKGAGYSLPSDDSGKATDPDAMYYRRKFSASSDGSSTRSVVIPFYWGFREEEAHINKTAPHGEWLDRNNNRLDKAGTKEGGQFANATTNLPDMWGEGFNGFPFGIIPLNAIAGTLTHPLFSAAGRRYMVLAAMRLAMLMKIIRKRYPNDTVNVVGHSQGTLIALLAHAFLKDEGQRPADGFVMLNSPYSLYQPGNEKVQGWLKQQTTAARIATLEGILKFISSSPGATPALSSVALKNCKSYGAIGGVGWAGVGPSEATIDGKKVTFNERDNRGSTYLYFTPEDQTVGLANVQGIGWQGVGEEVNGQAARKVLMPGFHQRVFTLRKRAGEKEKIGAHVPPYVYPLLVAGEVNWEDTGLSGWIDLGGRAELEPGKSVMLTAPLLPVPAQADFFIGGTITAPGEDSNSGLYQVKDTLDPVDAAIGLSNDKSIRIKAAWQPKDPSRARPEIMDASQAFKFGRDNSSVEQALNEDKETAQRAHVFTFREMSDGRVLVTRGETPYEARLRLQASHQAADSFHSSIPNNPEHSRRVLAYDVAIGAGQSVDDVTFYAYLCRVADWRLDWEDTRTKGRALVSDESDDEFPDADVQSIYLLEDAENRNLIDSTSTYRLSGVMPNSAYNSSMPTLVATQTWGGHKLGKPMSFGGSI